MKLPKHKATSFFAKLYDMEVKTQKLYLKGNYYNFLYDEQALTEMVNKCIAILKKQKPKLVYCKGVCEIVVDSQAIKIDLERHQGHNPIRIY